MADPLIRRNAEHVRRRNTAGSPNLFHLWQTTYLENRRLRGLLDFSRLLAAAHEREDQKRRALARQAERIRELETELETAYRLLGRCNLRQPYDRRGKQIAKLKDERRRLKLRVAALEGGTHEGRTAASLAYELEVVRQLFMDHHIFGTCPTTEHIQQLQDEVLRMMRLLKARYGKTDNWRVRLSGSKAHWHCSICRRTYAGPLEFEWASKPCPHPGAPEPVKDAA